MTKWTREKVFAELEFPGFKVPPFRSHTFSHPQFFTSEFLAAIERETSWVVQPRPSFAKGDRPRVGKGLIECPLCNDTKNLSILVTGQDTGIELIDEPKCECVTLKKIWDRILKVPERFQSAELLTAQPSERSRMSIPKQQALIDLLKSSPWSNYLFWGDAGTGKTYFATMIHNLAIVRWALEDRFFDCGVWRINVPTLLDQFVAKSTNADAPDPDLTIQKIRFRARAGQTVVIILEEIDKFKGSEFKLNKLFEIVDCVYECGGQIVATSNSSPDALCEAWGVAFGEPILRRICREPDGKTVHFQAD